MTRLALVAAVSLSLLLGTAAPPAAAATPGTEPRILINEIANGGVGNDSESFFELRNWGTASVDLTGWGVYRCSAEGLRANTGRTEGELAGIVLGPGEILTMSKIGLPGDLHTTQPYDSLGVGLWLENPQGERVDAVALYPTEPWPTQSECTPDRNLPNSLDFSLGESWQRFAATGNALVDFVKAPSTIDAPNVRSSVRPAVTGVVISELAGAGPGGNDDDFIELHNAGEEPEDIGGWELWRCAADGRLRSTTRQLVVESGTTLQPGERWVAASRGFTGEADTTYRTPLANVSFGVLVRTGTGELVDRVAVSAHADSACQTDDEKLPALLDAVAGESYQRTSDGFVIAPRTPGRSNAVAEDSVARAAFSYSSTPGVAISEIATDPTDGLLHGMRQRNFIELANFGDHLVDISGWTLRRCEATGVRSRELQATVPKGTILEPGQAWVAAREGTAEAAQARYGMALNFLGAGVWLEDRTGTRIDSVGIFAQNEMDASNVVDSPCTKEVALTTYVVDRMLGETFQRAGFTGVDADDFVAAVATPGDAALQVAADPVDAASEPLVADLASVVSTVVAPGFAAKSTSLPGTAATVLEAWAGASEGPLVARVGTGERRINAAKPIDATDAAWQHPYQRFVLDASRLGRGSTVGWRGSTVERNELQLKVWNHETGSWRALAAGSGPQVALAGELAAGDIRQKRVTLLVQDAPRTRATLPAKRDGALADPDGYDLSIAHLTDTQYLSESYPEVYAQVVGWIAQNAEQRKVAFATHTGDLVQNWVDPDQNDVRARREFAVASTMQGVLDDAGVPNSVLPGNHDNKRGADASLFNEFFGPARYSGRDWYGGSIAPGDNTSNFSTFERDGARFLMLSIGYAYGEREIAWAEDVVAAHPHHNVILSTHEHVTPKSQVEPAHRSSTSRWLSRADRLWERVIAPNRNVVVVLSGHFHGIGSIVTENAGGLKGHTVVELLADYQEFRTHTGERATGFQRLLQLDLDAGAVNVDTFSVRLAENASHEYDYKQFVPDSGSPLSASNARPWRIVDTGLQGRYTDADDEFQVAVAFQHPKRVHTDALTVSERPTGSTTR